MNLDSIIYNLETQVLLNEKLIGDDRVQDCRSAIAILRASTDLTPEDHEWLRQRIDLAIAEYVPTLGGTCPGRAKKDRFRALLTALEGKK